MAEQYKKTKLEFDNKIYMYLMKRVFEDISETDACNLKIVDSIGHIIRDADSSSKWAFTMLDKFIMIIKKNIGESELTAMLSNFEYVKYIDPLFIINMKSGTNLHKVKESFDKIISNVYDKTYLPDTLYHDDSYVELDHDEMNYCDHISRALTIASFLIYSVRLDRLPNTIEFDGNVLNSVESTFNVRSIGTYDEISNFCDEHGLTQLNKITKEGIHLIVRLSKILVAGNLLSDSKDRIENQSHNWKRLSDIGD